MLKRKNRGAAKFGLLEITLTASLFVILSICMLYQKRHFANEQFKPDIYEQKLKLPSSDVLRFLTIGYETAYADWLWLNSIQAFGSGWRTYDNTAQPIYNYFDVLTDLAPHFISSYRFGNLILADQRHEYELGQKLIKKGVFKNPDNYDLPYLGMYNSIWESDDMDEARFFSRRLRRIPDAPNFMKRLDEYIERKSGRYGAAFEVNVRYFIEYRAEDNDIEEQIIRRRMQDVLDKWYTEKFADAVDLYVTANGGEHPEKMEDLLKPEYMKPFEAPTMTALALSAERHEEEMLAVDPTKEIPQDLIDTMVAESTETIVGLPPDPYNTWYLIYTPYRESFLRAPDKFADFKTPYITSARDLSKSSDTVAVNAQTFIMQFEREKNRLPNDEEMKPYYGRDPLGGHYVYDRDAPESPKYGVFYSTATKRISEDKEPRLGLRGTGPFPFPIEPKLKEHEVDREWGIKNGYIDAEGNEYWSTPAQRYVLREGNDLPPVSGPVKYE